MTRNEIEKQIRTSSNFGDLGVALLAAAAAKKTVKL